SISGADHVEALIRGTEFVVLGLQLLDYRVGRLVGMKRVLYRAFERLIMFREWAFGKRTKRCKQPRDSFRIHDEWTHVILRLGVRFEVGNVVPHPSPCGFAPPNLTARRVPGFTRWITGSAVVHNATIRWPRPSPILIDSEARRIFCAPSLHLRTGL